MRIEAGSSIEGSAVAATRYGWAYEVRGTHPKITEKQANSNERRIGNWTFVDVKYTPADCSTPPATVPPAAGGSGGGGLPVTGSDAAWIGSVGGAVVAAGVILFVMARKRRIRTVA
jgi:LPXTG-motif cell wall-anchored protein